MIVPFYNNQHDLNLLLAALTVQTHPLTRLQIVVADDGSTEAPQVPDLAMGLDVTIVRQEDAGFRAGTARNLGFRRTDGEVVLFLDGDTVPSKDYVEKLARLPGGLPDAVVSGRRRYADLGRWTPLGLLTWFAGQSPGPAHWDEPDWMTQEYARTRNLLDIHPRSYKYLIGAVLGCSREMFRETGGFDESIVGYGGEDYDFTYRAYNVGAVLAYVPGAVAWHDGRDWAGRTEAVQQTELKNRELMMLAARIPEPSMRGRGQMYSVVDVLVAVHADGWSLGAGVVCIRSFLATLDCAVTIHGKHPSTDGLRAAFTDDPRVRDVQPGKDTDEFIQSRARLHIEVSTAVGVSPEFADWVMNMLEGDVGTLLVSAHGRPILTAESHRRRSRLARYPGVPASMANEWFSHCDMDLPGSGLVLIGDEPKLAAIFGGY